jgi:hypothetical protein
MFNKRSIYCIPIIRQHIWFTGTSFFGYEDVGDGPGKNPAKHVMMIMVTALNMSWKLPVAYFLLPDSFPSQKRAELLRVCLYKLNCTGAIITNLVMDNCPGGYNGFIKMHAFYKNMHFFQNLCFFQNLPNPDPLVRGMDPRIRIHTKMSWIRNTAFNKNLSSLICMHTLHGFTYACPSQVSMRVCTRRPSLAAGIMRI